MSALPKDRRIGRLHVVVLILAALLFLNGAVTQYLAHRYGYSPYLGAPVSGHFYWPWQWVIWAAKYYHAQKALYDTVFSVVLSSLVLLFGFAALLLAMGGRKGRPILDLHGSAHWATEAEIHASGLLPEKSRAGEGVYVGAWTDPKGHTRYLRHNGPEHVLVFAPTRSGKGVSLVLPTLLSWPESVVVLDIKGENWALTAGWRKQHANNLVLHFDPTATDQRSARFNPLEEIRMGTDHEVADVQNIVTMIVDPDGKGLNDHWAKTGHALLVGTVLHLLYKAKHERFTPTLLGVSEVLSDPRRSIQDVLMEMLEYPHLSGDVTHPVVAASARDMLNKAENERSGVLSTAMSFLTLYRDPVVANHTAVSDFKIRDLMNREKPLSLYLVVRPSDKDRLKPLLRLIINQIVRILVEKMEFQGGEAVRHYSHRLLLLIDEFPSLGRLEVFQEALGFIAAYGLKAYLIVQDMTQLYSAYGRNESIVSNCHIRVAFAPNTVETAELLSKMTGSTTVVKKSVSISGKRFGSVLNHVSETLQEVQRPLLTPDECMRLPGAKKDGNGRILGPGNMLVFPAGFPPIYGTQLLYFKDPQFSERAQIPPPEVSDVVRRPSATPDLVFSLDD